MNCEAARAAMDEEFAGDDLGERGAQLREHLKTCDACRERYDRLARVEAQLSGGGLSEQKMDALQARILGNVGKTATTAPSAPPPVPAQRGWGTFLAAAAVVFLVAAFAIRGWLASQDDQFTPRGGGRVRSCSSRTPRPGPRSCRSRWTGLIRLSSPARR